MICRHSSSGVRFGGATVIAMQNPARIVPLETLLQPLDLPLAAHQDLGRLRHTHLRSDGISDHHYRCSCFWLRLTSNFRR